MNFLRKLHPILHPRDGRFLAWNTAILPLLLIALIGCLYSPAVSFPFTNWDDIEFITENPCLRAPTVANVKRILTPGGVPGEMIYIPVTYFSFLLERILFSPTSEVVHATNILLHMGNALLVFYLIGSLLKNPMAALIGAILFSVHPIVVEPVVWAMGRKDLLSTTAGLLALIFFRSFVVHGRMRSYLFSLVLFSIALLAKPSMITLPIILIGVHAYIHRSLKTFKWVLLIPFLLICVLDYGLNSLMPDQSVTDGPSTVVRLIYLPWIITGWGTRFFLVKQPSPFYCWPSGEELGFIVTFGFAGLVLVALFIGAMLKFRRINALSGLIFFLVAFIPALVVVFDTRDFVTADRYGYFPSIGIFFLIASLSTEISRGRYRRIVVAGTAVFILFCIYGTSLQVDIWSNSEKLWRRALKDCPRVALIRNNLGLSLIGTGRVNEAIEQFKVGIELDGEFGAIRNNLGRLYFEQQDFAAAIEALESAVALNLNDESALKNLGDVYAAQEQSNLAQSYYVRAISANPEFVAGYIGLGNSLNQRGELKRAERVYDEAIAIDPGNADLHYNLGIVREKQGNILKAVMSYNQAINYRYESPDAHYNLGNIYSYQGSRSEAERHYLSALKYDSSKVEAIINLGNLYFEGNRLDLAEQYYRRAISVSPTKYPGVYYNLGVILSRKKNLNDALALFETTRRLKPDFAPAYLEASKVYLQLNDEEATVRYFNAALKLGLDVDDDYEREIKELSRKIQ